MATGDQQAQANSLVDQSLMSVFTVPPTKHSVPLTVNQFNIYLSSSLSLSQFVSVCCEINGTHTHTRSPDSSGRVVRCVCFRLYQTVSSNKHETVLWSVACVRVLSPSRTNVCSFQHFHLFRYLLSICPSVFVCVCV